MLTFGDYVAAMRHLPVLLLGLALVLFNSITGHQLYHVNTLKLFMLGIILSILWGYALVFHRVTTARSQGCWQWGLLLLLPTFGFLPGGWFNPIDSVYFPIELVTDLLVVGWAVLLTRMIDSDKAVHGLLMWLLVLFVVIAFWVGLQGISSHPLTGKLFLYDRPEGTFGNVNYLAGFLAVVIPLMLLLALPDYNDKGWHWGILQRLCTVGFIALVFSITLAYSRAAIAASVIASIGSLILVGMTSPIKRLKHISFLLVILGVTGLGLLIVLPFFAPGILEYYPSRFASLYDIQAWWGRLVPMRGAVNSILASPLVGWGLGSSYNLNFSFIPTDSALYLSNVSYNHLHNEWLEMGQEGGLLGILVWACVMLTLVVLLLRYSMRQQQHFLRFIAIGIIGGLAAFYTHGIFSVAQRMIVANLPLYTLLGLAGAVLLNERQGQPWFDWQSRIAAHNKLAPLNKHIHSWQLVLVGLLAMWLTFYPWLRSFNGMVKLNGKETTIAERVEFFDQWPNPYGLSDLLNKQIGSGLYKDAKVTGEKIERVLPNYRQLKARLAEIEINLGNIEDGRELAYQQYKLSNFLPSSNLMLAGIDLADENKQGFTLFFKQLLLHALIYASNRSDSIDYVEQIKFNQDGDTLAIRALANNQLEVSLPPSYIDTWFELAGNPKKLNAFVAQTFSQLSTSNFFLPDFNKKNQVVELVNQITAEKNDIKDKIAKKNRTYRILNQNRKLSSFQIKTDLSRIKTDVYSESAKRQSAFIKQLDKLLDEAELGYDISSKILFDRLAMLKEIHYNLYRIAVLNNHVQQNKN